MKFTVRMASFSSLSFEAKIVYDGVDDIDITNTFARSDRGTFAKGTRQLTDDQVGLLMSEGLHLRITFGTPSVSEIYGTILRIPPDQPSEQFLSGSIGLISFDDISCQGNQVRTTSNAGVISADVIALAPSIRAIGNRFTELPDHTAVLSYLSWAMMNTTTNNQATHCIYTGGSMWIEQNNQERLGANCAEIEGPLSEIIRREET